MGGLYELTDTELDFVAGGVGSDCFTISPFPAIKLSVTSERLKLRVGHAVVVTLVPERLKLRVGHAVVIT